MVLPVLDWEDEPEIRPWESLKVVVLPDVLVVVEILLFSSLSVAFLPARVEVGSAKARTGITRANKRSGFIVILRRSWRLGIHYTSR